jgi:hypothetical protein
MLLSCSQGVWAGQLAAESVLNLKGKTEAVSPIDLAGEADLASVLAEVESGFHS